MPPPVAAIACFFFIAYVFWRDSSRYSEFSNKLWIPFIWIFLAGSRYVSSWFGMTPGSAMTEGSPVDAAVFLLLIVSGVYILSKRNLNWNILLIQNIVIVLYFSYCLSSIFWTEEPFILFKRWVKELGIPVMALVVLTETRPYEAILVILRRLSFLLLPLSVLFIKYYPELGRVYHVDGTPLYVGAGHQKNDLGTMCMLSGVYLSWKFLQKHSADTLIEKDKNYLDYLLIMMVVWLLYMSNSQTSLVCLVVTAMLFLSSRLFFIASKPSRIILLGVITVLSLAILEVTLDLSLYIFKLLGRRPDLTNRTAIWEACKQLEGDPLVGVGFQSFWMGNRLDILWQKFPGINQAHNGYLEQYFNLGYIGVFFIVIIMLIGLFKVHKHLDAEPSAAMLRLCFIIYAIIVNYTEASFYGLNNSWLLLIYGVIDISGQQKSKSPNYEILSETSQLHRYHKYYRHKKGIAP